MINIVVTMQIKPGRMDDFLAVCAKLRPLVLAERGCLAYDYTREIDSPLGIQEPLNPDRITLLERWESLDAVKAHMNAPHMKEFGPRLGGLRESVVARVTEPVF